MNVALVGQRIDRVRNLAGFKRTHRVPDEANEFTAAFVARIAAPQIDDDLDRVYDAIRGQFRFKRAEMKVSPPTHGAGSITTPYFCYSVIVLLNAADPSQVIWRHQITEIRDPEQILADKFAEVFGNLFDTVELAPARAVDLVALIDRIEDLDSQHITLTYDKSATWCRVKMYGVAGDIEITAETLSLVQKNPPSPGHLLQAFLDFRTALVETHDVGLIAFDAPGSR